MWKDIYNTSLANFQSTYPFPEGIGPFLNLEIMQEVPATGQRSIAYLGNSDAHVQCRRWLVWRAKAPRSCHKRPR